MLVTEEELSVEVAKIDCVKVDNVYFSKACQDQVLEEFASDSACAHHEHTRL